jgi:hypothetical protein
MRLLLSPPSSRQSNFLGNNLKIEAASSSETLVSIYKSAYTASYPSNLNTICFATTIDDCSLSVTLSGRRAQLSNNKSAVPMHFMKKLGGGVEV